MSTLAFASTDRDAVLLERMIRGRSAVDVKVVALSLGARIRLRQLGVTCEPLDGFVPVPDRRTLRFDARFFSRFWYEVEEVRTHPVLGPLREYKGYPLLQMQTLHLFYWMGEALASLRTAQALLDRFRPEEVLLPEPDPAKPGLWYTPRVNWDAPALGFLCGRAGIRVTRAAPTDGGEPAGRGEGHGMARLRTMVGVVMRSADWLRGSKRLFQGRESGSRILVITRGGYYFSQLLPYVQELSRREIHVRVASPEVLEPEQRREIRHSGAEEILLNSELLFRKTLRRREFRETSDRALAALDGLPAFHRFLTTREGIEFWPHLRPKFEGLFREDIPVTLAHLDVAENLLRRENPDLLVSGVDVQASDATFPLAARRAGIPTLGLQHGTTLRENVIDNCFASETYAVYGEIPRRLWAEAFGMPSERHPVVGHAEMEKKYRKGAKPDRGGILRRLHLEEGRPVCLFLGALGWVVNDVERYAEEEIFRTVLALHREIPGLQLVVRLHGGETVGFLRDLAHESGIPVELDPVATLPELFSASDVVISQSTTAGLEAMAAGCPLVYLNIRCDRDWLPYATSGAALGVYEAPELAPAVRRILEDRSVVEELRQKAAEFLEGYVGGLRGDAANRMTEACQSLLRKGRSEADGWREEYRRRSMAFLRRAGEGWNPPVPLPGGGAK